jgi:hypothetical protein
VQNDSTAPYSLFSCAKITPLPLFMSASSYELPSRPENVLTRHLQNPVSGTTGFESATHTKRKSLKSRGRQRLPHNIVQEPTEELQNPLFAYFQEEAEGKEGANCVFLLWGSRDSESSPTCAVDVQITGLENEEDIFQRLAQRYSAERGSLRRYLSFREYDKIEPVTVCFL